MDNFLYIPKLNPLQFYEVGRANIDKYFSKFMDKWMFAERLYDWHLPEDFTQIWQTTDIVRLQFESTFNPLIVRLQTCDGVVILDTPMIQKGVNKFIPGTSIYECEISLAGLQTGCYSFMVIAGASGSSQKFYITPCNYISATPIRNSVMMEYWSAKRYHRDVIFATDIKFQKRVMGHFGFLDIAVTATYSRDQKWNSTLLNSNDAPQYTFFLGDEFGVPDEEYMSVNAIWSCDNVLLDGKPFGISEGSKVEPIEIDSAYPKRGFKYTVEEGINRSSSIFSIETDTTKKLLAMVFMDKKATGDFSNSGSTNAVPVKSYE